jgi:hypothetical protein
VSLNALLAVVAVVSAVASVLSFGLSTIDVWQQSRRNGLRVVAAFLAISTPLALIAWYATTSSEKAPALDPPIGPSPVDRAADPDSGQRNRGLGRDYAAEEWPVSTGNDRDKRANSGGHALNREQRIDASKEHSIATRKNPAPIVTVEAPPIELRPEDLEVVILRVTRLAGSELAVEVTARVGPRPWNLHAGRRVVLPQGTIVFGRNGQTRTAGRPISLRGDGRFGTAVTSLPIVHAETELCARFVPDGSDPKASATWQATQVVDLNELKAGDSWSRPPEMQSSPN